jgi:hypothetical protein
LIIEIDFKSEEYAPSHSLFEMLYSKLKTCHAVMKLTCLGDFSDYHYFLKEDDVHHAAARSAKLKLNSVERMTVRFR